jgi:hypothetical protein
VFPYYRYDFPFVLEDELDPFVFRLVVIVRGFCKALGSAPGLGAASFMTILACISSSLEALTFLGQKRVTNLQKFLVANTKISCR